jgi:hypothetical protein
VLVVANVTAPSGELVSALQERAAGGPTTFRLIIPATRGRAAGQERLAEALEHLGDQELEERRQRRLPGSPGRDHRGVRSQAPR